jgi:predicted transcriptional regulator
VRYYLMSIKPKFGEGTLSGAKKYELRRLAGPLVEPGIRSSSTSRSP